MHISKGCGHGVVVSKICYVKYSDCVQDLDYRILIVLSVVTCDCCKPMKNCQAFSNSGMEAGLPAFQLPTFAKCDALPTFAEFFGMFVSGINSCHFFCRDIFFHEEIRESARFNSLSWESGVTTQLEHRQGRCLSCESVMDSNDSCLWIFCTQICCPRSIQETHACRGEVSIRFFGLWSPRPFVVASSNVGTMFPCNKTEAAMKNCRDWVFSHGGLEVWWPGFQMSVFGKCDSLPKRGLCEMFV